MVGATGREGENERVYQRHANSKKIKRKVEGRDHKPCDASPLTFRDANNLHRAIPHTRTHAHIHSHTQDSSGQRQTRELSESRRREAKDEDAHQETRRDSYAQWENKGKCERCVKEDERSGTKGGREKPTN